MDQVKMQMVAEIRDMKNTLNSSITAMQNSVMDMTSAVRENKGALSTPSLGFEKPTPTPTIIEQPDTSKEIEQPSVLSEEPEHKEPEKPATHAELSEAQSKLVTTSTVKFLDSFSGPNLEKDKQTSLNQLKLVLNLILQPNT